MKLVVLGGGTGSFVVLQGLRQYDLDLSAIVNMCDDGGSTGILRDELGVLPPGDARQCLIALSEAPEVRDLFNYRFADGRLAGQSLGNIILSGLELQYGSFEKAIEVASRLLHLKGQVIPVVLGNHQLILRDGDKMVEGQFTIKNYHLQHPEDTEVSLLPVGRLNAAAKRTIAAADVVVLAPGDFYSSLLPVFSVPGIKQALTTTNAKVIMVANLVNKPGQTDGWHVVDYVRAAERYLGKGSLDLVLYNTKPIRAALLRKYATEGELPVAITPHRFRELATPAIGTTLVSDTIAIPDRADRAVRRTLIRHEPDVLAREILAYGNFPDNG